ncbi:uncharacterized protein LOC106663169 isoform X2 [Cimex lectularius]|uniref:Uncharacterized protein n=1 Tax=Cimex lectularius TaxID=79782 RepID=A0A8I6RC51_CIMLE|nr:uncharacterized protein LOC106663169 isoform X2 [Cimex lectularius]
MPQVYAEEEKGKKKKWWGDLFKRRVRKVSDSSSDDEEDSKKKGFLSRRKKHDRGSKDVTNSFLINPGIKEIRGRSLENVRNNTSQTVKKRIKAKVEASREQLKDSSSDEGSSYTSSIPSGGSFPRRSRAARTERHNRRLWSASVVYQESNDYDTKYRAKTRSATPSPAASPKVRQRASAHDIPAPPPRKMELPKYHPPVYTTPVSHRGKPRYNGLVHHGSDPVIPKDWVDLEVEEKKPPAPPKRLPTLEDKRRQANLEEALNELEAIYKKLEDLQEPQEDVGEPLVTDDMAYRRLNRREPSCQDVRDIMSRTGSYLLVSPTLSPPPLTPQLSQTPTNEPDVTFDDVVYRSISHTNNTLKIVDPQPPFGIPLGPISTAPNSDYLHAQPNREYRPPDTPDLVRDDLAFRNLRKDSQELRKKKAVRSFSANLSNVILKNNNNFNAVNNNIEGRSHSYSDIPEEMRLAQRVLDMRKRNKRQARIDNDELRKRFFEVEYAPSETDLLKELEDEARATSLELEEQLSKSRTDALYSRSMADLLKELTKNLDSDFGCSTCDDYNKGSNNNHSDYNGRPKFVKAFSAADCSILKNPLLGVSNKPPSPNFRRYKEEPVFMDKPRNYYFHGGSKPRDRPWESYKGKSASYHGQHGSSPSFDSPSVGAYMRQTPSPKHRDTSPRRSLERLSPMPRVEDPLWVQAPRPWTGFNGERSGPKHWQTAKSLDERYRERLSPRPRWSSLKDKDPSEDMPWHSSPPGKECLFQEDRLSPVKSRWSSLKNRDVSEDKSWHASTPNKECERLSPVKTRWSSVKEKDISEGKHWLSSSPGKESFLSEGHLSPIKLRWSSVKEKDISEKKPWNSSSPGKDCERLSPAKPRWPPFKDPSEAWHSQPDDELLPIEERLTPSKQRWPTKQDARDDSRWDELNEICQKMQSDLPSTSSSPLPRAGETIERTPTLLTSSPIDLAAMEAESEDEKQQGVTPNPATHVNTTENAQL